MIKVKIVGGRKWKEEKGERKKYLVLLCDFGMHN
jgi:hypothetical protein